MRTLGIVYCLRTIAGQNMDPQTPIISLRSEDSMTCLREDLAAVFTYARPPPTHVSSRSYELRSRADPWMQMDHGMVYGIELQA